MRTRLTLEALEDRCTPSSLGQPWPDAGQLTVSFAPDGTMLNGAPSDLFATLNNVAPTWRWERVFLKAFETWEANANINIGLVADDGQPFGVDGAVQGDPRFGDIRIGMQALPANLVATTAPFSWTGSTWSGDIILNSSYQFTLGGQDDPGTYDLFTVVLHEAGHALGLASNSTDPQSIMYADYNGPHTGLDSLDIANIQAMYGAPLPDADGNNTLATATLLGNAPAQLGFNAGLNTPGDVAYYQIVTPDTSAQTEGTATVTIAIDATGLSLLTPTITVYDDAGDLVATQSAYNPFNNNNVSVTLTNVGPLSTYYFEVGAAGSGTFGVGVYSTQVSYLYSLSSIVGIVPSLIPEVVNTVDHANTAIASATMLTAAYSPTLDPSIDYLFQANLVDGGDTDYYQLQAPAAPADGGTYALNAIVWQTAPGGLAPVLHLFDANGNPIAIQVFADSTSTYSIQVLSAVAGAVYYLEVAGQTTSGLNNNSGGYTLGISFTEQPETAAPTLGGNTLLTATSTDAATLVMNQNGVFYFELAADNGGTLTSSTVTMTVYDDNGNAVGSLNAATGSPPQTTAIYLTAGTYTIGYAVSNTMGLYMPVSYWLSGEILSDPIGPYYSGSNPPPPPDTSSTTTSGSNGAPTVSSTSTFAATGASVTLSTPDGNTISLTIPPPGGTVTQSYTTAAGTTTVTLTTSSDNITTLTLTTPASNAITNALTTSGDTSTQTWSTSDGIQVTLTTPVTTAAPTYSGSASGAPPPYYY